MHKRILGVTTAALLSSLGLAACGNQAAKAPATRAPASAAPASAPSHLTTVTLEIPNPGAAFTPFYVGQALGIYKHYGINLKLIHMAPPLAVQAILSGKLDFMSAIGSAARSAEEGEPMRIVEVVANHLDFVLVGAKGITHVSQLRNQTVVGESAVGEANLIESMILKQHGLPPGTYKVVNVEGGDAARAALVEAGKAQATVVEFTGAIPLQKKGFPILATASKILQPFTGLATSLSFLHAHPGLTRRMVIATIEATRVTRDDEAKTVPVLMKTFHMSKQDASTLWKDLDNEWGHGGRPNPVAIQNEMKADQAALKLSHPPKPSQVFDFNYLPKSQ